MTKKTGSVKGLDSLPVLEHEDPWTKDDLAEIRGELEQDKERLAREVEEAEAELGELMRAFGDCAGDDQADASAATWEREHEMSLMANARDRLAQTEHALERMNGTQYGVCESCGKAIGKMRLMAFSRAALCLSCKQEQER